MNADGTDFAILPDQHINAVNMRRGSAPSAQSSTDDWESIGSTTLVPNSGLPGGINIGLGGTWDETNNRLIWVNWNSFGASGIFCFDLDTRIVYRVLAASSVTGAMRLSKYSCIHSCFAVNNNFYWVDGTTNEPRRINVDAGIKTYLPSYVTPFAPYSTPIAQSVIAWIRRPPGLPPTYIKSADGAYVNNFIRYESFEFMYRYQYRDYEFSTLSSYSPLAPYNDNNDNATNLITIAIPFGEQVEQDVLQVDLVALYLNTNSYRIIKSWNKNVAAQAAEIAAHNAGTTPLTYAFYSDQTSNALDAAYSVKPYDSVPIYAETCGTAKNRTFLSNYTAGYDTPTVTSLQATVTTSGGGGGGGGGDSAMGDIGIDTTVGIDSGGSITGVTIGGAPVAYISGGTLPMTSIGLGNYLTTNLSLQDVVVSITGPGGGVGTTTDVIVSYGPGDGTFTDITQSYTGDGDYTFSAVPIASAGAITWKVRFIVTI